MKIRSFTASPSGPVHEALGSQRAPRELRVWTHASHITSPVPGYFRETAKKVILISLA